MESLLFCKPWNKWSIEFAPHWVFQKMLTLMFRIGSSWAPSKGWEHHHPYDLQLNVCYLGPSLKDLRDWLWQILGILNTCKDLPISFNGVNLPCAYSIGDAEYCPVLGTVTIHYRRSIGIGEMFFVAMDWDFSMAKQYNLKSAALCWPQDQITVLQRRFHRKML